MRLVMLAAAAALALVAPAHADVRGCSGSYSAPATCTFQLAPGDTGYRLTIHADPNSAAAGRIRCCRLLNPVTGQPVADPTTGEDTYLFGGACVVGGPDGGVCSYEDSRPVVGLVGDDTVTCDLAEISGYAMSGTWACEPI